MSQKLRSRSVDAENLFTDAAEIVVPPATVFVVQGVAAAGTTPLLLFGIVWEEMNQ